MILLSRLENLAKHKKVFSEMQFGFQEGVGLESEVECGWPSKIYTLM